MEINIDEMKTKIEEADMVLIGIGEEFEQQAFFKKQEDYVKVCTALEALQMTDLMPYINYCFMQEKESETLGALWKLQEIVKDKNYFVVSTCMNDLIDRAGFRKDRRVQPCGGFMQLQCEKGCEESVTFVNPEFLFAVKKCLDGTLPWKELQYPTCEKCNGKMIFNSLYAENYDEKGYLDEWNTYMKWLQGTLNRKVCILELGVGMKYPSVIRWPFEKTGYLNKKANFIRVHERMYQLTPELKEQGYFIPQNAVNVLNLL